jgi:hypothetical protein
MVKIAINTNHKNKMPTHLYGSEIKNWWKTFNGDFRNYKLPVKKLMGAIQNGYSYTTQHHRYRKSDNFICGQHIGLDFDTGNDRSAIGTLLENKFIKRNASFIHTTASHTTDKPRTRVIFILEVPIRSRAKYSLLAEAFAETFSTNGGADVSCKDPVRLFFGAENCEIYELGNILKLKTAAKHIVLPYKEKLVEQQKTTMELTSIKAISDGDFVLTRLVNKILDAPNGEKWYTLGKVSRTAGGYVAGGYFSEQLAFDVLFQAIASRQSTKDLDIARDRIQWGIRVGKTEPLYTEQDLDPLLQGLFA